MFLIDSRTETAEGEHELMKGTGRILCPCSFCLVPAEKLDILCSANELSAAITVYTAASEPRLCAFWRGAPQGLTRSMDEILVQLDQSGGKQTNSRKVKKNKI